MSQSQLFKYSNMSDDQPVSTLHHTITHRDQTLLAPSSNVERVTPTETSEPNSNLNSTDNIHSSGTNESNHHIHDQVMTATPFEVAAANRPIKVPGSYPPDWIPDQHADSCMACECLFTLIKRRHHCRSCGKIFCGDCCKLKAKLLYMDNKEARVCNNCFEIIEFTLIDSKVSNNNNLPAVDTQINQQTFNDAPVSTSAPSIPPGNSRSTGVTRPVMAKVHGVLKSSNATTGVNASNGSCNTSSTSSDQHSNKQVIFADGIRPGTDLSEPSPVASSSSSETSSGPFQSFLTRQHRRPDASCSSTSGTKKSKVNRSCSPSMKNITVCDELGYLPPIVISKDAPIMNPSLERTFSSNEAGASTTSALTNLILSQFKSSKKTIEASMESRSCPLNGIVKFNEICDFVGLDGVVTLLLLKDFELKVKIIRKGCCMNKASERYQTQLLGSPSIVDVEEPDGDDDNRCMSLHDETHGQLEADSPSPDLGDKPDYWCFLSNGLERLGQEEVLLVIDKDKDDSCIPRDVFKIYLTLHELALRRQALEHMGNLLFQDGLFGNRDTAGLLLVRPPTGSCLNNLIIPTINKSFLVSLVLQRWEVPWAKVFPMRLLLRLGHKYDIYPYPIVSFRSRDPVYYEIGHTIISILGDFRNFRYSITHVDGLKVTLNKSTRKILIQLAQSNYQQFNKVLDSANNEHVLAWSSCPIPEADGHLVCVQNDDGQYETVEFHNKSPTKNSVSSNNIGPGPNLGASFVVFSGALKINQTGQPAKISIVEDGLLIQIQSCTMSALKNAIHFMHHFDIDCENSQDPLNRVEIDWLSD